jgi:RHH-type rel operon transcriptional repressor/antitoxin RelB
LVSKSHPEIEQRLGALAKKTGRSKIYCAREAILRHIEDIEDYDLARRRLGRGGPRVTLEKAWSDSSGVARSAMTPPRWRVEFDRSAVRDARIRQARGRGSVEA